MTVQRAPRQPGGKNLLIIDDDLEIGHLIARIATDAGFSPIVLTDPAEFRRLFDQLQPSIVTMDVLMPDADGVELMAWMVQRRADCRIVIVSGADPLYAESMALVASSHGAKDVHFLPKPLDLEALRELFRLTATR